MVSDLLALDKERKHNAELNSLANKTTTNTASSYKTTTKTGTSNKTFTPQRSTYRPFIPVRPTNAEPSSQLPSRPPPNLDRFKSDIQPTADSVCYNCKKPGHWSKNCPLKSAIKEIYKSQEADKQTKEFNKTSDTDLY